MTDATQQKVNNRYVLPSVSCLLIAILIGIALTRTFYFETANDLFFSVTLASTAIVFLRVRRMSGAFELVAVAGVLVGLQFAILRIAIRPGPVLALLGLSAILLTLGRKTWGSSQDRSLLNYVLIPSLFLLLFGRTGAALLEITGRLHPATLDLSLYAFDASLGIQLAFRVGQILASSRLLYRIAIFCYYALPAVLTLVYAEQLLRRRNATTIFLAFFIAGPIGVISYNLFPACGPIYLVGSHFPSAPASAQQIGELLIHPVVISGARNAFPSLHMAWALLALWYTNGLPQWTRRVAWLFLAGTVLATLGLGEHYFIDLVVAFPFALMIEAMCAFEIPLRRRVTPFLSGLLLLLGWILFLRFELGMVWVSPVIPWILIGFTVAATLVLRRQIGTSVATSEQVSFAAK